MCGALYYNIKKNRMSYCEESEYNECCRYCEYGCGNGLLNTGINMICSEDYVMKFTNEENMLLVLLLGCKTNNIIIVKEALINIQSIAISSSKCPEYPEYIHALCISLCKSDNEIIKCVADKLCTNTNIFDFILSICRLGNLAMFKIFHKKMVIFNIDINTKECTEYLFYACQNNRTDFAEFLVENGFDVKNVNYDMLSSFAEPKNYDLLVYFVEKGVNLNISFNGQKNCYKSL